MMAEEIERYLAKVNFQHKFQDVMKQLESHSEIWSPTFFARNIPFKLHLSKEDQGRGIFCQLINGAVGKGVCCNVEFVLSLITPSKTIQSAEFSCTSKSYYRRLLSEIFPGQEIIVDDAVTIKVSLFVEEPQGTDFQPPKEKLRKTLQILENQAQNDALASLLDSEDFSDVTFVVSLDSSKVRANKGILTARSQVFARMLTSDTNKEIRIDDMGTAALKIMLRHIYTAQLGFPEGLKIDLKICQELVNAGEKYGLQNLKEYAAMAMTEFVSLENAWELLLFAKRFKAEAATKALASYIVENIQKMIENA